MPLIGRPEAPVVAAIITSAVTLIIVTVITPYLQARTRRSEQWEEAIATLMSVLSDTLPPLLRRYRVSAGVLHHARSEKDFDAYEALYPDDEEIKAYFDEVRAAKAALAPVQAKMDLLIKRITRVRPEAPAWKELHHYYLAVRHIDISLDVTMRDLTELPSRDKFNVVLSNTYDHEAKLRSIVEDLWLHPKRPSRKLMERMGSAIRGKIRTRR